MILILTLESSLGKFAKGSAIVFTGTIASLILGFISQVLIIRFTTQNEYGIYSLSLTIIYICITLSSLGMQEGTTRFIAYFSGRNETAKVQEIIISSILVSLVTSIIITLILIVGSCTIVANFFDKKELSTILKILSLMIPFTVLSNILISIFRGFNKANIRIYFNDIFKPLVFILLLCIITIHKLSFKYIIYANIISLFVICLIVVLYFFSRLQFKINWKEVRISHTTKELITYSIPLFVVSILLTVMSWTDTLFLGIFKTTEQVAIYNTVYPIANLLSVVINSIGYLYVPVVSKLYSSNNFREIGRLNANSTKWSFILTVPVFTILFLYPKLVLNILYGSRYIEADNILQVLSFGFLMNSYFGFNYYTLMSLGKSKLLMNCSIVSALINIFLNLVFIPSFGSLGAAIASAISFILIEIYMTTKLYTFYKIHPFTKTYLKLTFLTVLIVWLFHYLSGLSMLTIKSAFEQYALFLCVYLLSIVYMGLLDREELSILAEIRQKLHHLLSN